MSKGNDLIERLSRFGFSGNATTYEAMDLCCEAAATIASLSEALAEAEKKILSLSISKNGKDIFRATVKAIPANREWEVSEVARAAVAMVPGATFKEVYSAVAYLKRKGRITRLRYGRYSSLSRDLSQGGQP